MIPTYHNLQLVVLDRRGKDFSKGDVVAFHCEGLSCVLVKRIVACPGDTVVIRDGTLFVNEGISRYYGTPGEFSYAGLLAITHTLDEGQYAVIGDNVEQSKDSRYRQVGMVDEESMIGKVL